MWINYRRTAHLPYVDKKSDQHVYAWENELQHKSSYVTWWNCCRLHRITCGTKKVSWSEEREWESALRRCVIEMWEALISGRDSWRVEAGRAVLVRQVPWLVWVHSGDICKTNPTCFVRTFSHQQTDKHTHGQILLAPIHFNIPLLLRFWVNVCDLGPAS